MRLATAVFSILFLLGGEVEAREWIYSYWSQPEVEVENPGNPVCDVSNGIDVLLFKTTYMRKDLRTGKSVPYSETIEGQLIRDEDRRFVNTYTPGRKPEDSLGSEADEVFCGSQYDDNIRAGWGGDDTFYGFDGNDYLRGQDGDDKLYGGLGDDWIKGRDGADRIHGNNGNEKIDGGEGNDRLFGNEGNDSISGGRGNDYIHGGQGKDILRGEEGYDVLKGGLGGDLFFFEEHEEEDADVILDFSIDEDWLILVGFRDKTLFVPPGQTITSTSYHPTTGKGVYIWVDGKRVETEIEARNGRIFVNGQKTFLIKTAGAPDQALAQEIVEEERFILIDTFFHNPTPVPKGYGRP